jgi:hypothetical protein
MSATKSSLTEAGFREMLKACRPEDFDGHTAFKELSAEQRIEWLDELIEFVKDFKGLAGGRDR